MTELCSTRNTLILARQEAADAYAKAVAQLAKKIGVVSAAEYRLLSQSAEIARKRSQKAHLDLEKHIAEHGCGDMIESQAS
jgi:Zn finger protein HypA/HybF involved in hydrogenase expression